MPIGYRKRGSGITERFEVVFGRPQDIRAALFYAAETQTFEGCIRRIDANARAILKSAGFDPENRQCLRVRDDTSEDFCDRILTWIKIARGALADGDADRAARAGLAIGQLVCAHDMKFEWEKPALAGAKAIKGSREGGRARAKALETKNSKRDVGMAREFLKTPKGPGGLSKTARKVAIGKSHGLGKSASVAAIGRGLQILSGKPGTPDK